MQFFGAEIKPGKPFVHKLEEGKTLRLTQASLGENIVKDARSVLTVNVDGRKHVIAILLPEKSEHILLDLMFEDGDVEFAVTGKNSIHIAGNLMDNDEGDEDVDLSDEDEEDEEDGLAAKLIKGGANKKAAAQDDDEDDEDDDEMDEDDEDEEGEEDDEDEDDEDEDEDDEEETAPPPKSDSKKRPAPAASTPAAKQQKSNAGTPAAKKEPAAAPASAKKPATPAPAKKEAAAATPAQSKTPAAKPQSPGTPGTPGKPIPADVKEKSRELLKANPQGIKSGEWSRLWQAKFGKSFKESFEALGYKKQGDAFKAMPDVIHVEGDVAKLAAGKK